MYDPNGNRVQDPSNSLPNFGRNTEEMPEYRTSNVLFSGVQYQHQAMTVQIPTNDMKSMPAVERAQQEAQRAMEREYVKQQRLQQFQRKTKLAAKNYNKVVKSEAQIKQEKEKQEAELKQKKVKEFEEKLKTMRKTMKVKPAETKKETSKAGTGSKKGIQVKVYGNKNGADKENQHQNRVYKNSIVKQSFGATSI